jgi:hypothetical protein
LCLGAKGAGKGWADLGKCAIAGLDLPVFAVKLRTARKQIEFNESDAMHNRPFNLVKEKSAPINWRRGMFRLWILASAAWIMGWIIFFLIEFIRGETAAHDTLVVPVILFGPPVALLLFGLATRWAFQGFKTGERVPGA